MTHPFRETIAPFSHLFRTFIRPFPHPPLLFSPFFCLSRVRMVGPSQTEKEGGLKCVMACMGWQHCTEKKSLALSGSLVAGDKIRYLIYLYLAGSVVLAALAAGR